MTVGSYLDSLPASPSECCTYSTPLLGNFKNPHCPQDASQPSQLPPGPSTAWSPLPFLTAIPFAHTRTFHFWKVHWPLKGATQARLFPAWNPLEVSFHLAVIQSLVQTALLPEAGPLPAPRSPLGTLVMPRSDPLSALAFFASFRT